MFSPWEYDKVLGNSIQKINDEVSNEKKIDEIKTKEQNQDLSSGSIKSEEENLEMKPLVESRGKNESKENATPLGSLTNL